MVSTMSIHNPNISFSLQYLPVLLYKLKFSLFYFSHNYMCVFDSDGVSTYIL